MILFTGDAFVKTCNMLKILNAFHIWTLQEHMKKCLIECGEAYFAEQVAKDDQQSDMMESEVEETSNLLDDVDSEDFEDLSVIDEAAYL